MFLKGYCCGVDDKIPVTFYFDESNHDRKVRISEDAVLNIWMRDRCHDKYVGCFVGWADSNLPFVERRYFEFEASVRKLFNLASNKEVKSELVKFKKYKDGLASFSRDSLAVYKGFFEFLLDTEAIWQVNAVSKIDLFLRNGVGFRNLYNFVYGRAIFYTFAKFFEIYADADLMKAVVQYCDGKIQDYQFVRRLVQRLDAVLAYDKGIARKRSEVLACENLKRVFKRYRPLCPEKCVDFDYDVDGVGLSACISDYTFIGRDISVFVDKERRTCEAIRKQFASVVEVDSEICFGVRVADMLAGFISRMLVAIANVLLEQPAVLPGEHASSNRRLIPVEWVDLRYKRDVFELYKLVASVLISDDFPSHSMQMASCFRNASRMVMPFAIRRMSVLFVTLAIK